MTGERHPMNDDVIHESSMTSLHLFSAQ